MVLDTDVSDDENDHMESDTDEQEVDAIVDDYMAEDEDERGEKDHAPVSLPPAPLAAPQPGPSQHGAYPVDRPALRDLNQRGDASRHNTPRGIPVGVHVQSFQNSLPPHHHAPIPYQAPHVQQQIAVGAPAPYPQRQTAGPVVLSTQQPMTGMPGQHVQKHAMSVPTHHVQQHAIGIPSQFTQQHGPGVPAMYAPQQAMSEPSPFVQQHPLGVPGQYHPQRQAYAPVHPLQHQQSASHRSTLPSSSAYPSPGNQPAGYTPNNLLSSSVAPPEPPVRTSDRQFGSIPPVDDQRSARTRPSQQSFRFVNVDPTQPPSERRRLTAANSLSSLPETLTQDVGPSPVAAAPVSRRKPPSRTSSSRNVAKERPRQPVINEQRYEPPRDPPAYEPPPFQPGASDNLPFDDHRAPGSRPNESGTSGPSRDPCKEIVERLSSLDEADRRRVIAALYHQERTTEMDVDEEGPGPSKGKGKRKSGADGVPALAMVLDKVQRVEEVCRDNAQRSKQFEAQVQVTLTKVQQEMAGLKNVNPRTSKYALQARRAVKPPRASRQSRAKQAEEHLPPNFGTMAVGDQEIWLRRQKDQLDLLAHHVRTHLKKVLGFSTWKELVQKNPPLTANQIKLFGNPKTGVLDVFPDRRLHFDFEQSWEKFSFNREASKLFVADFLSKVKAGQYSNPPVEARYVTEYNVAIALTVYMDTCRRNYREVLDPISEDEKERRADSSCKNGRRGTLLRQRKLTTVRRGWNQFDPLWVALTAANMSDDETDSETKKGKGKVTRRRKRHWPTWTIIRSLWQSDKLVEFLHEIDKHYRRDWENPGRYTGKRKSSGQPPRRRYLKTTSKVEDGVVPRGLWRNCYNAAWLKTLRPDEVAALQIINEDFDLEVPFPARDTSDEESDGEDENGEDEEME
ncbi:hypothetical protein GSI_14464 [Ganoderma sinense ZZ0214-1]|uniref:Uncharacterized protein n=1 Tax=Ganoderma sinense ZZ0214-1 TaxID=1077348 RepID=A0A2G8RNR7_9APHY|nr:hypothetical protein GSI_14464 [Ganoderma sinense ZZ0214-1]